MSGLRKFLSLKREVEAQPERRVRLDRERLVVRAILGQTAVTEGLGAAQQHIADTPDVDSASNSGWSATLGGGPCSLRAVHRTRQARSDHGSGRG